MIGNGLRSKSIKIDSNPEVVNPQCSCPECDSMDCFTTRNTRAPCSCVKCKNSKTCFYYSNKVNMNESKSELNMGLETNSLFNPKEKLLNEHIDKKIVYDYNKNTKSSTVAKKQSKNSHKAGRSSDFWTNSGKDDRPYTKVHSVSIKYSRKDLNSATANLSAQVMNVPYKDFKNSISANRSHTSYERNSMTNYDILKRIKEAYKACSCKVCECIVGKSLDRNELCKCKPCDCNDCTSFLSNFQSVHDRVHFLPIDGCPCKRCTRSQCKGIANKFDEPQICDCNPCDCIKCYDSFSKRCDCKLCQCVECKAMSVHLPTTLTVTPVGEHYQRNVCQCSPCDCIECGHSYGMSSNLMREMSTTINRYPFCHCETCVNEACEPDGSNNSCKCQTRNKIIRKPTEKDLHDYDIRAIVTKKYSLIHNDIHFPSKSENDTIAMFTTLPNQYPKTDHSKKCNCHQCECLACNSNENTVSIKSSQLFKVPTTHYLNSDPCKCSSCECQSCFDINNDNKRLSRIVLGRCICDTCNSLNCESVTKASSCHKYSVVKLISKFSSKGVCKHNSGQCVFCRKLMHTPGDTNCCINYSSEVIYPIKRGKLLTPSILNGIEDNNMVSNNESQPTNMNDLVKNSALMRRRGQTNVQNQSNGDVSVSNKFRKYYQEKETIQQLTNGNILVSNNYQQTIGNSLDSNIQCDMKYNILQQINRMNTMDLGATKRYLAENSSLPPSFKSCNKEKIRIKPYLGQNNSFVNSCNSCDSPNYLIKFPNNSVQTYNSDVLKLNLEINVEVSSFNIDPKQNEVKTYSEVYERNNYNEPNSQIFNNNYITLNMLDPVSNRRGSQGENNEQVSDTFKSDINHLKKIKKTNSNYNTRIKTYISMYEDKRVQTNDNVYNQGKVDNDTYYIDKNIEKNTRYKFSDVYDDIMRRSNDISSDPQFHLDKNKAKSINDNKQFVNNYLTNNVNLLNLRLNYKRAQKTLHKAKAYSLQLMKILDKYEKANMEFQSVSQKLKISHNLLVDDNINLKSLSFTKSIIKNTINNNKEIVKSETEYEIKEQRIGVVVNPNDFHLKDLRKHISITTEKPTSKPETMAMKLDSTSLIKHFDCMGTIGIIDIQPQKTISVDSNRQDITIKQNDIDLNAFKDSLTTKMSPNYMYSNSHRKRRRTLSCYRSHYSKLLRRSIIMYKKINLARKKISIPETTKHTSSQTVKHVKDFIHKTDMALNNPTTCCTNEIEDSNESRMINLIKITSTKNLVSKTSDIIEVRQKVEDFNFTEFSEPDIYREKKQFENGRPWPIFKKNLYLEPTRLMKNKGVCIFPSVAAEVKEAVHLISLQTNTASDKTTLPSYENKALKMLQIEVKELMNMPLFDPVEFPVSNFTRELNLPLKVRTVTKEFKVLETNFNNQVEESMNLTMLHPIVKEVRVTNTEDSVETDLRIPTIQSTKSSCDALKVSFLGLRRVSDHTVLVKWNVPRIMTDIQGYELQIDGRAVQKILSPSRNIAVVTCLPHSDKVLLTIRTITSTVTVSGHYPSVTVIYRPRNKY